MSWVQFWARGPYSTRVKYSGDLAALGPQLYARTLRLFASWQPNNADSATLVDRRASRVSVLRLNK